MCYLATLLKDAPLIIYRDGFLAVYNSSLAKLERKQPRRRAPCKDWSFSLEYKPPPHPASCKVVESNQTSSKILWQEKSACNQREDVGCLLEHQAPSQIWNTSTSQPQQPPGISSFSQSPHFYPSFFQMAKVSDYYLWQIKEGTMFSERQSLICL